MKYYFYYMLFVFLLLTWVYKYNNKAVNLLAGVVERASGQRMDTFIAEALFEPLGIHDYGWTLDKSGNPHAMSGLQLGALDMARLGQLVIDKGKVGDRQVVSADWIERASFVARSHSHRPSRLRTRYSACLFTIAPPRG